MRIMTNNMNKIFPLKEDNLVPKMWGGNWIAEWKNLKNPIPGPIGESWEFSCHPNHPSLLSLSGVTTPLPALSKEDWLELFGKTTPFLLKFIDAQENLSIQVHPSEEFAQTNEKESGKSESWIILSSSENVDEGYIYLGFQKEKSPDILKDGPGLLSSLNKIKVKPGDTYDVPPGTVHTIGKGVRLFEIQQNSDLTYRIWDWDRKPERPLHLTKAQAVLNFDAVTPEDLQTKKRTLSPLVSEWIKEANGLYTVHHIALHKRGESIILSEKNQFFVLTGLKGTAEVKGPNSISLRPGISILVPACLEKVELKAGSDDVELFKSFIPGS